MSLTLLSKQQPAAINALFKLKNEIFRDGALTSKEKALMAVSLSCMMRCDICLETWAGRAREMGATVDELRESILVAMYMAGPASAVWSDKVDAVLGEPLRSD